MADTPWSGSLTDKLYLQSGQFTSTLKISRYVGSIDSNLRDIEWDGTNTPWSGSQGDKLYLQSGQFTSTLKTSEYIGSIDTTPIGISFDRENTPWMGNHKLRLYLQSGQFSSTLKDSIAVGPLDIAPTGVSSDPRNTPWAGTQYRKLFLLSGRFTATLKTSVQVLSIDSLVTAISWDGINTPWSGKFDDKLYLQSGQFTSTLKTSEYIGGTDTDITGISTNNYSGRMGIIEKSTIDSLVLSETYGLTFVPYDGCAAIDQWPRWILASAVHYFGTNIENRGYLFFLEGQQLDYDEQIRIEFRMNGPDLTQLNPNYYHITAEINLLWSYAQGHVDLYKPERIKGILMEVMDDFCVYRFGEDHSDDQTLLGKMRLKQNRYDTLSVSNLGRILIDTQLFQGSVAGNFEMFLGCND
jgi:hypothetical protein